MRRHSRADARGAWGAARGNLTGCAVIVGTIILIIAVAVIIGANSH